MKSVGGIYDPENPDWLSWRMPTMIAELRKISTSYDTDFDSILYTTLGLCEKQDSSIWQTLSGHLHVPLGGLGVGLASTNNYKSQILEPQYSSS